MTGTTGTTRTTRTTKSRKNEERNSSIRSVEGDQMSKIANLNSHPIRVERPDGSVYEYPPDGRLIRLQTEDIIVDVIDENPIIKRIYYAPEENILPNPKPGVWYIVPSQVTQACKRPDFISPDTKKANGAKRDLKGQVLSVRRFRTCDELRKEKKTWWNKHAH